MWWGAVRPPPLAAVHPRQPLRGAEGRRGPPQGPEPLGPGPGRSLSSILRLRGVHGTSSWGRAFRCHFLPLRGEKQPLFYLI